MRIISHHKGELNLSTSYIERTKGNNYYSKLNLAKEGEMKYFRNPDIFPYFLFFLLGASVKETESPLFLSRRQEDRD